MRKFEEFLETNEVRRTSQDIGLARSRVQDANQRAELILQLALTEKSATLIYEQVYESLRAFADSFLALSGYKSYSHVATIAFLQKYPEITALELNQLDNAREKRNLSKYYAKQISITETKDNYGL